MYGEDVRWLALEALAEGYGCGEAAAIAGCSESTVRRWARLLREEGVASLMTEEDARAAGPEPAAPPSELEELRARCEELELRKCACLRRARPGRSSPRHLHLP